MTLWYRFGGSETIGAGGLRTLDAAVDFPPVGTVGTEDVSVTGMSSGVGGRIKGGNMPGGATCVCSDGLGLMSTGSVAGGCESVDGNCAADVGEEVLTTSM